MSSDTARRTAIVATLGPVSSDRATLTAMVRAGMDTVRLSMSNGSRDWHTRTAGLVRDVAAAEGRAVRLMADLQGRKNRIGELPNGLAEWHAGDEVVLTARPGRTAPYRTWTTYPWEPALVPPGSRVVIDDGAVTMTVIEGDEHELRCRVQQGGPVTDGRGLTMPGALNASAGLTERDIDDLRFARSLGVELVALSFARSTSDYAQLRGLAPDELLIGKIEQPAGVARVAELAACFDGLMVARGDLGLEIPFEDVPIVQQQIIAACVDRGKSAMVATQLLHSMRTSTMPMRAEVSDIAHAVFDGADALMVTGETSYGQHPVRVIEVLDVVIRRAERHLDGTGAGVRPRSSYAAG
jgi:pyruvate kinase